MPRTTKSPDKPQGQHRTRRSSKPKFELPPETAQPEVAAAWVHRTSEAEPEPTPHTHPATEPVSAGKAEPEQSITFIGAGMALMSLSITLMEQATMAAWAIFTAPIRMGRSLLGGSPPARQ